jgi:hypothetical protein
MKIATGVLADCGEGVSPSHPASTRKSNDFTPPTANPIPARVL